MGNNITEELTDIDDEVRAFNSGDHTHLRKILGVWQEKNGDGYLYRFRTHVPNAIRVELIGDLNAWSGIPMTASRYRNIWECEIKSDVSLEGTRYKYRICTDNGVTSVADMCDGYSLCDGRDESVICTSDDYEWISEGYQAPADPYSMPMNICSIDPGSFKNSMGEHMNYHDIAEKIIDFTSEMKYTHVELCGTPCERRTALGTGQTVGFSFSSRHGLPEHLMYLVDRLHIAGTGALARITLPSAEHIRDMSFEEESLIVSSVIAMKERFRFDGVVISLKTPLNDEINREVSSKLHIMIQKIKNECERFLIIADETVPPSENAAADVFDLFINSKWANVVESVFIASCETKKYLYPKLNYETVNSFEMRGLLPLNASGSNRKPAFAYMILHPGKKMVKFNDIRDDLYNTNELNRKFIKTLNELYISRVALWKNEFSWQEFEWICHAENNSGVSAFIRRWKDKSLIAVVNFENRVVKGVKLEVGNNCNELRCIFSTEEGTVRYISPKAENGKRILCVDIPPLSVSVYEPIENEKIFYKTIDNYGKI